jgi:hypothetical protein
MMADSSQSPWGANPNSPNQGVYSSGLATSLDNDRPDRGICQGLVPTIGAGRCLSKRCHSVQR